MSLGLDLKRLREQLEACERVDIIGPDHGHYAPEWSGVLDKRDLLRLVEIAGAAEAIADANPNDRWWDHCCGKRICAVTPELMDRLLEAVFGSPPDVESPQPDLCPKCGGEFRKPKYHRRWARCSVEKPTRVTKNGSIVEWMETTCDCGYYECRPCRDATPSLAGTKGEWAVQVEASDE